MDLIERSLEACLILLSVGRPNLLVIVDVAQSNLKNENNKNITVAMANNILIIYHVGSLVAPRAINTPLHINNAIQNTLKIKIFQ